MTATVDAPAKPAATEDERRAWFARFGYTGEPGERVMLHGAQSTARAEDVWDVLVALRLLQADYGNLFHRLANWATGDWRPRDPDNVLCTPKYGSIVAASGEWATGRREIVAALLDYDDEDVAGSFSKAPLRAR